MIIIKTTLSSFNCLQIFEKHKKKENNKTRRETQWDHQSAVPPQQTRLPAFACLPSLLRSYLHTHDTFQAINQARSRARERERDNEQAKTKQKISMNRSRKIFSINMCGRNGFREVKRARHKPRILNYGTHKGRRGREGKRHKRTLNLHKINSIIV